MNILPVQLDDADNDNGCGDGVHGDDDDDDNQEVGCTLNVDGTLVAQLPPLDPGKTKRRAIVSKITINWDGGGGQP